MQTKECAICHKIYYETQGILLQKLEPAIQRKINKDYPNLGEDATICFNDVLLYRLRNIEQQFQKDGVQVKAIDHEILKSIKENQFVSKQIASQNKQKLTLGQKVADTIAKFGGSWTFIFIFFFSIVAWIALNVSAIFFASFDPYPFILLNLILSCLAAIQAPIIMMSQNRQEDRDRRQSENDYQVNMKAEIEVRLLHEKMDHLLYGQMLHLQEVQDIQIELLNELKEDLNRLKK